jgi:hypothetical protein
VSLGGLAHHDHLAPQLGEYRVVGLEDLELQLAGGDLLLEDILGL